LSRSAWQNGGGGHETGADPISSGARSKKIADQGGFSFLLFGFFCAWGRRGLIANQKKYALWGKKLAKKRTELKGHAHDWDSLPEKHPDRSDI